MNIWQVRNFITPYDCNKIIDMAQNHFLKATIVGGDSVKDYRVAEGMWFNKTYDSTFIGIKLAIAKITGFAIENQEDIHVVRYDVGGEYKPHHDYFDVNDVLNNNELMRGGQRVATALLYLNDNFEGGQTHFEEINNTIEPETGKLIIWNNVKHNGSIETMSKHSGLPVHKGMKYLLLIWIREKAFA